MWPRWSDSCQIWKWAKTPNKLAWQFRNYKFNNPHQTRYYIEPCQKLNNSYVCISNCIRDKVWDEIVHPFPNFNGTPVEVWELISNFIPHFTGLVITHTNIMIVSTWWLILGLYHALRGGRQRTTGEYIHGNRQMGLIPIMLSLMVTHISTMTLLGYPAEIYAYGGQYWVGTWGVILGVLLACGIFVPVFYPLQITSVNEVGETLYPSFGIKDYWTV